METSATLPQTPQAHAGPSQATPSAPQEPNGTSGGTLRFDIARLTLPWPSGIERMRFTRALEAELRQIADKRGDTGWRGPIHTRIERMDLGESRAGASAQELARFIGQRLAGRIAGLWGDERDV